MSQNLSHGSLTYCVIDHIHVHMNTITELRICSFGENKFTGAKSVPTVKQQILLPHFHVIKKRFPLYVES